MGVCTCKGDAIEDFIILRNDGTPTYNLSVVCDDHTMNISHIIRGNDHLSNTFKQIAIYKGMGWSVPFIAHLPLIVNQEGKKLSKRDGDISIKNYLKEGFLPETLISFLIRLGWSFKDEEIFSITNLLEIFPQGKFQKSPACYNESKLLFQNKYFLSLRTFDSVKPFILNYWNIKDINNLQMAQKGFDLIKSRCNTLKIISQSLSTYIPELFDDNYENLSWTEKNLSSIKLLQQYFSLLNNLLPNYIDNYNNLNNFMKNYNIEPQDYQQIFRYILTKEKVGPHLFQIIEIIGIHQVNIRINQFKF
jgi:glutamyl-tRNA synthetase